MVCSWKFTVTRVEELSDCPDDMVGIDGPLRGFDAEMGDLFFERGDRDSGAYGKLEMSYNGIEMNRAATNFLPSVNVLRNNALLSIQIRVIELGKTLID